MKEALEGSHSCGPSDLGLRPRGGGNPLKLCLQLGLASLPNEGARKGPSFPAFPFGGPKAELLTVAFPGGRWVGEIKTLASIKGSACHIIQAWDVSATSPDVGGGAEEELPLLSSVLVGLDLLSLPTSSPQAYPGGRGGRGEGTSPAKGVKAAAAAAASFP